MFFPVSVLSYMWLTIFLIILYFFTTILVVYLFCDNTVYLLRKEYKRLCTEAWVAYQEGHHRKGQELALQAHIVSKEIEKHKSKH